MKELDIIDVVFAIFILIIAIGIIWLVNQTVGALIPTSVWLLIIGVLGVVALYIFVTIRKRRAY